jgi:AAA+ superfamily predicted ATPase
MCNSLSYIQIKTDMANETKTTLLQCFSTVFKKTEDSKLEPQIFEELDHELGYIANYLSASKNESLLFTIIFSFYYSSGRVCIRDIFRHFEVPPTKMLEYSDELQSLCKRGLILKNSREGITEHVKHGDEFSVNESVCGSIQRGEPIADNLAETKSITDVYGVLELFDEIMDDLSDEKINTEHFHEKVKELINQYSQFPLIEKLRYLAIPIGDKCILLYMIWKLLEGKRTVWLDRTMLDIYKNPGSRFLIIQEFIAKEHLLLKEEWLEMEEATFFDDVRISLSEKSIEMLNESGIKLFNNNLKKKDESLILPESIPYRELIYSKEELQQVSLLKNFMLEDSFKKTQEQLQKKALPIGVTAILHGAPGTGKTETVLQLAKATNRSILKVDISASRTMWFGESEKIIKKIFTEYNKLLDKMPVAPILFLNEADAILSKRKDVGTSNVSDTENRIQNILLEEIENFKGILIATSNLVENMDKAFERRFLFKVKFNKPDALQKSKIWRLKLPFLNQEQCEQLSTQFEFSGGQIDNIVRKCEITQLLYNTELNLQTVIEFCEEEFFECNNNPVVGFKKH